MITSRVLLARFLVPGLLSAAVWLAASPLPADTFDAVRDRIEKELVESQAASPQIGRQLPGCRKLHGIQTDGACPLDVFDSVVNKEDLSGWQLS